ncbi:hypothetical protein PRUB_a0889 [Pseudoalteromonas rubra]|uniref:Uncharacterized protein n=1 Tax=Pseudoalteromonas rubra TaxID=43658 RepID=A0A8T0C6V6_9GAMM|nr:hypothetical protein PRUB_a0889 [Pseudoalteromonas rubra]
MDYANCKEEAGQLNLYSTLSLDITVCPLGISMWYRPHNT